jgi:serine O-acetyltransferase
MINTISSLKECLIIELGERCQSFSNVLYDLIVPSSKSYIRQLRITEFLVNTHNPLLKPICILCKIKLQRLSSFTGISIPINTCEAGLTIYHHGSIVVNSACRIGRNCCISNNVNIGANGGSIKAPCIGDNVYIGPGAVIFGDIRIADNCYIGANSVVCKSVEEPNSVVVGCPAKIIRKESQLWWQKNGLNRE